MSLKVTYTVMCDLCKAEQQPQSFLTAPSPWVAPYNFYDRSWSTNLGQGGWMDLCSACMAGPLEAFRKRAAEIRQDEQEKPE